MEIYYTKSHEWVKVEANTATIGITEHAVSQLGDIVFIDLPQPGNSYKQGDTLAEIESVKAASDIYAAVSGKVIEVNSNLTQAPETINNSPADAGWIAKLELSDASEINNLMNADGYQQYLKTLK